MARDPYEVLGVTKTATEEEIKRAYRKLARQYHPDRNRGDKQAETRFKEVQAAYEILSDKDKRARYDRVGFAPEGGFHPGAGGPAGFGGQFNTEQVDLNEFLRQMMGGGMGGMGGMGGEAPVDVEDFTTSFGPRTTRGRRRSRSTQPARVESEVSIPFLTAARGGALTLDVDGRTIELKVPAGTTDGKKMRLAGQGPGGADLIVKFRVEPHPYFQLEGNDVLLEVPLTLTEATLGTKVDVPTMGGERLTVTVKPGTSGGSRLRLRGYGIDGGHQFLVFKIVAPAVTDERGRELLEELARLYPQNPRVGEPWS
jgi:curved DNA-binding protein